MISILNWVLNYRMNKILIGGIKKMKSSETSKENIDISVDYPTLIIKYIDQKGAISKISSIFSSNEINIATMKVTREDNIATMIVETDTNLNDLIIEEIKELDQILYIKGTNPTER